MSDRDREVLARDAAAQITDANCEEAAQLWNELEVQHLEVKTVEESAAIVERARQVCDGCPALMFCAEWARTEEYSGLAAGGVYENGERMPATWVSARAGRRPSARAS